MTFYGIFSFINERFAANEYKSEGRGTEGGGGDTIRLQRLRV